MLAVTDISSLLHCNRWLTRYFRTWRFAYKAFPDIHHYAHLPEFSSSSPECDSSIIDYVTPPACSSPKVSLIGRHSGTWNGKSSYTWQERSRIGIFLLLLRWWLPRLLPDFDRRIIASFRHCPCRVTLSSRFMLCWQYIHMYIHMYMLAIFASRRASGTAGENCNGQEVSRRELHLP